MSEKNALPKNVIIPNHIAIILDGNRRWAHARKLKSWEGHAAGYIAVKKLAKAARDFGVHTFTIWAFSTDNWSRPKKEIAEILRLLKIGLKELRKEAQKEKLRIVHLGRKDRFPKDFRLMIQEIEDETRKYSENILNLALDYGGHDEIIRVTQKIITNNVPADKVNEDLFTSYLDNGNQPYPYVDLFIRTSGEQRTSGFMPWQIHYAEFYWELEHLPDFTPEKLKSAILDYSRRRRRFGGNDTVEHLTFDPKTAAQLELSWWKLRNISEGIRLREYTIDHIEEQFGLSKNSAKDAAKLLLEAFSDEKCEKLDKATHKMGRFYQLIKNELRLTFEPKFVALLEIKLNKELTGKNNFSDTFEAEKTARELYAEIYRISLFQAAKIAHLRVMATVERNMAEAKMGESHWIKAQDYLEKYYYALKEQVA